MPSILDVPTICTLRFHRIRTCAFLVVVLCLVHSGVALANGWAHGSIPFKALLAGLSVEDATTRARSAQFLGLRGRIEAAGPLIRLLDGAETVPEVRSAAYVALGRLGDLRGVAVLEKCLEKEDRAELRADCVLALGELHHDGAPDRILTAFRSDPSILVKSRAIEALGLFSNAAPVAALSEVVLEGRNPSLRFRAIRALGQSASPDALAALLFALEHPLSDEELLLTVAALSRVAAPEAVAPLRQLLETTDNARLRVQITVTLAAIRDGGTLETLIGLLEDDVPAVRYFAVEALQALNDSRAVEPLRRFSLNLLQALDKRLRREDGIEKGDLILDLHLLAVAIRALVELEPGRAETTFSMAARLHEIALDSSITAKIAEAVYECRRLALYGLGYTHSAQAEVLLLGPDGVGHPDFLIRATAARSLAVLAGAHSVSALIDLLSDDSAEVRWTAALGLGRLRADTAVPALVGLLADTTTKVREEASLSLGYIGDDRARVPLANLTVKEQDPRVLAAAALALDLIRDKESSE